jgi:hypothetical protein
MRTSVLGIPHFEDLGKVIANTQTICKVINIFFIIFLLFIYPTLYRLHMLTQDV